MSAFRALAGVDGCPAGWVAAIERAPGGGELKTFSRFEALLADLPGDALVVVDMPIGLPERISGYGRSAEQGVRELLGSRRASIFAIPARAAVEAAAGAARGMEELGIAHARSCVLARSLSDPPRGVSRQGFMLFRKILELDTLLRADPALPERVLESHPEAAFTRLNGGTPMSHPKKRKGEGEASGLAERRAVLRRFDLGPGLLDGARPKGAGEDDRIDACAMLLVARAAARGQARPVPEPLERDGHGLPVAIWLPPCAPQDKSG